MKKIKLPHPMKLAIASISAFWIANIIHSAFNPIGVMVLLLIPILVFDLFYPQQDKLIKQVYDHKNAMLEAAKAEEIDDEPVAPEVVN